MGCAWGWNESTSVGFGVRLVASQMGIGLREGYRLTLGDDAGQVAHTAQVCHCGMCRVWFGAVQIGPSQETTCPIALACGMAGQELMVVNGPICLVEGICALGAPVIRKSGCY